MTVVLLLMVTALLFFTVYWCVCWVQNIRSKQPNVVFGKVYERDDEIV